ncbi:MAG: TIGR00153 family protein [Pseudomonadota bacterium]
MNQRSDIFSRLFGDSLITPIKHHMAVCNRTAETLVPFFDAVLLDNFQLASTIQHQICELEQEADVLKKHFRLQLPSGMLLSVSRNDLLELVRAQDKIANVSRDLAGLVCGRAIHFPGTIKGEIRVCIGSAVATVQALEETLNNLDTLVGTGFIPSRMRLIEAGVDSVDDKERLSDSNESEARHRLFDIENKMDPIDVMFLYQVIDLIGEVADRAQAVANRIRIVIAN